MTLKRAFMPVALAGGLFFLVSAAAAGDIQRSNDQEGTIHIRNTVAASQKKTEAVSPSKPMAPAQKPPSYGRRMKKTRGLHGELPPFPKNFGDYYKPSKPDQSKGDVQQKPPPAPSPAS